MAGDEDQLTEMLVFLWQEAPDLLERWLEALGIHVREPYEIETQFVIPSKKRPDIAIRHPDGCVLVESKLGAGFHDTQVNDYLEYLGTQPGTRALILLTQRPEVPRQTDIERARAFGVQLISQRWHDMATHIADAGEESLAGDFVQLLIREGLVKPDPLLGGDWSTWNAGYNVTLRLGAFLDEVGPHVLRMRPDVKWKATNGLSKRWLYRVWRSESIEVGLGFGAAPGDKRPHGAPVVFAFTGSESATDDDAFRAVGVDIGTRYRWSANEQMNATCGLTYSWPTLARNCEEVLTAAEFEDQVDQAVRFMYDTATYFQGRGYWPAAVQLRPPSGHP
jgi:hypothetical protein